MATESAEIIYGIWPKVEYERPVRWGWTGNLPEDGIDMEFRLTYEGPLKASADLKAKHVIRQQFHQQLSELWNVHGILKPLRKSALHFERLKESKCGFNFVPLVRDKFSLGCGLDILFLRRETPGNVVHGGDIDNRLKTLIDALKMPESDNELKGIAPTDGEDPFFCVMEKDSLLCDISVITDRLLWPIKPGENPNTVHLVIQVKVSVIDPSKTWVGWGL
jgi:hypothetical protein